MDRLSDVLLLSTKLKMPAPRRNYIVRRTLFRQLSQCSDRSVIFVSGGAGSGKTTLLSSFIRESGLQDVGWLSLDSLNTNVYSFWYYFAAAARAFLDDDGGFLEVLRSNPDASKIEVLLTIFINKLCSETDYYLVLDDVHYIKDEALTRSLEFFIRSMPKNLHLFMLSREDPPVYLGALAVSGRLLFIDGRQMQLTSEEGMEFLKQTLKLSKSDQELSQLNEYAEGWIGGLQLAAAVSATDQNSGALLRMGGGIASEYLTREIFESLSKEEQDFLIGTGYLSYFDANICEEIFSCFSESDFTEMIEKLILKNLFIICIDEQNGVYRYHNILSEYLTRKFLQMPDEGKSKLLAKSSCAFEQRGDPEEALRELCMAGDYESVMRVAHTMGGSIEAWSYLDRIPPDILMKDADLAAQCFMYNVGNLDVERCRLLYEKFEEHYHDTVVFKAIQFANVYISKNVGRLPEYHMLTIQELNSLNFGPVAKAMIFIENAIALLEQMKYKESEEFINQGIKICNGANPFIDFAAYGQKAQLYEEVGRLNESLECYRKALDLFESPSMMSTIGINFYIGLTGVYLRQMDLNNAQKALDRSVSILHKQPSRIDVLDVTLLYHFAEINFLKGDADAGTADVDRIISNYPNGNVFALGRLIQELECEGRLREDVAERFLREYPSAEHYKEQPFWKLLYARLMYKRGEAEQSLQNTEQVLIFAREHQNRLRVVEAESQEIVMLTQMPPSASNRRRINNLLREEVYYAYENRILMPIFLDRRVLLPLLRELACAPPGKSGLSKAELDFVHNAIAVCSKPTVCSNKKGQNVLSARELDVLCELARGITNREIAEKLCISQATVKTHVLSIFGKLGVSSRMMAVQEGRKMGLIKE